MSSISDDNLHSQVQTGIVHEQEGHDPDFNDDIQDGAEMQAQLLETVGQYQASAASSVNEFEDHLIKMRAYAPSIAQSQGANATGIDQREMEAYKNAPMFTSTAGSMLSNAGSSFLQYSLLGLQHHLCLPGKTGSHLVFPQDSSTQDLILANMNIPWSAFICGSQGAGKSHTLSCLLENALVAGRAVTHLPDPLAAVVFHYDNHSGAASTQVCEAAYLCSSGIPVTVLVAPSNIWVMQELYSKLPGLPPNSPRPRVLPLYLSEDRLNIQTILKLMAVDLNAEVVPLYMGTIMGILREMAMEGKGARGFSYAEFRERIECLEWSTGQLIPLNMRLELLDSFLKPNRFTKSTRPAPAKENIWEFEPGSLTIVDLSDPFISSADACSLFSICLSLFLEDRARSGRVVALDEAHKFLLQSGPAHELTQDLISVIREQRHSGTRVLIATQEPTLSPEIIDLVNVTFVHRFLSPAWYDVLSKHLAGAKKNDTSHGKASLFETIVALQTGEALVFCPTALVSDTRYEYVQWDDYNRDASAQRLRFLHDGYMKIGIRKRLTADGGRSILASDRATETGVAAVTATEIPMHIVVKTASKAQATSAIHKTNHYR